MIMVASPKTIARILTIYFNTRTVNTDNFITYYIKILLETIMCFVKWLPIPMMWPHSEFQSDIHNGIFSSKLRTYMIMKEYSQASYLMDKQPITKDDENDEIIT